MVEYDKIVNEELKLNFLAYLFAKNGLVSLFISNNWDEEEMPYGLIGDLDLMFLQDPYTTYKGVLINNLSTKDKQSLTNDCIMVYEQLAKYFDS